MRIRIPDFLSAARASLLLGLVLGAGSNAVADELADAIAAASRATDAARQAAENASSAAQAVTAGTQSAQQAVEAAMQAAKAAESAARAATDALDAAKASTAASAATAPAPSAAATGTMAAVASTGSAGGDSSYAEHVQCAEPGNAQSCKIDLYMTRGFRAFSQCQVCHGLDAAGSSFAPSLVAKLNEIDKARFVEVVTDGYRGQIGVMPPWKTNPNVMNYMDQLYAYLMARADGAIPPGKIQRFDR